MVHPTRRVVALSAALAGGGGVWTTAAAPALAATPARGWPAASGDMSLGTLTAPVHVVEYLSLTCPHCADFHLNVFPAFKAKYIDTGRVYFTLRELLTAPANVAAAGFLLARCRGGARYFPIVEQVFRSHSRWRQGDIKPIFLEIAKANGINEAQFESCLTDEAANKALEARLEYATGVDKVTGTPAFFVNGARLDSRQVPTLADLDAAIAKALRSPPAPGKGRR